MRILGVAIWIALASVSCASGNKIGEEIDGGSDGPVTDATVEIDGPKSGFGEACTDSMMCDSGICILVGTSGQCSKLCGQCPDGYGCLGVSGVVIEGQVSFVCVPTSNQLCSPCTADTECTLLGMDKCDLRRRRSLLLARLHERLVSDRLRVRRRHDQRHQLQAVHRDQRRV